MQRLRVYADATALIGLARIDRLDILSLLPLPIYVTERVWREVASDVQKAGAVALLHGREVGLLAIVDEGDPAAFPNSTPGRTPCSRPPRRREPPCWSMSARRGDSSIVTRT